MSDLTSKDRAEQLREELEKRSFHPGEWKGFDHIQYCDFCNYSREYIAVHGHGDSCLLKPEQPAEATGPLPDGWAVYKRVGSIEARPYTKHDGFDTRLSVSAADSNRETLEGGMVARNPDNHDDRWYIAPEYFAKHYGSAPVEPPPAEATGSTEPDWKHPKLQALLGENARKDVELRLVESILDAPNYEASWPVTEYWNDMHEKLQARLSHEPTGWQPIETAPKDGGCILVCGGKFCDHDDSMTAGEEYRFDGIEIVSWRKDCWYGPALEGHDNFREIMPTHWHRLPAPPEPKADGPCLFDKLVGNPLDGFPSTKSGEAT